ncbi:NADH:ubiquinone oxidoreductase [archaeon SCG-AAA382B04]|nr:NADH:ubiquinone oxidoreductase [archaeon SCG-AAA382B04]
MSASVPTNYPIFAIIIPLIAGFAAPIIGVFGSKIRNIYVTVVLGIQLILTGLVLNTVLSEGIISYAIGHGVPVPSGLEVPVRVVFEVDAIGAFFGLFAILSIFLASIYSFSYLEGKGNLTGFYTLVLVMAAGSIGFAYTGDLFNLFVFLEVTSISAVGLVAYPKRDGLSAEAAFKFLVISVLGGLVYLFGVGILYGQYDVLSIAAVAERMQFGIADKLALISIFSALAMKLGSVPMHMWVPDAYGESPAPVSMMMVVISQLSLYGLVRISFSLYGLNLDGTTLGWIIVVLGLLTMFVGVTMALIQKKLKRLMAYCAISQIGYILLGVGAGLIALKTGAIAEYGLKAIEGGLFHMVNDVIYMGLLFLTAGALIYKTKERSLNELGGLAREMPVTVIAFIVGAGAISGIPPFNGFASKFLIYESVYKINPFLTAVAMLVSVMTLAIFVKVFQSAFLGPEITEYKGVGEVPTKMKISMVILSVLIILFGLFPNLIVNEFVEPAAMALVDQAKYIGGML